MKVNRLKVLIAAMLAAPTLPAYGEIDLSMPKISGFLSAGATVTDSDDVYEGYSKDVEFSRDTLLGLQVDAPLSGRVRLSAQLLAIDEGGDFGVEPEWTYAGYRINSSLEFRAGRLRIPNNLFSENIFVGISYPYLRTPAEVYQILPTTKHNGFDLTYNIDIADSSLYLQPYVGQLVDTVDTKDASVKVKTNDFFGMQARLETSDFEFMLSYLHTSLDITVSPSGAPFSFNNEFNTESFTAGLRWEKGDYEILSEYTALNSHGDQYANSQAYYVTGVYHLGDFSPYFTVAIKDDNARRGALKAELEDNQSMELGCRYNLEPGASITMSLQQAEAKNDTGGLFGEFSGQSAVPDDDKVNIVSLRFDIVF